MNEAGYHSRRANERVGVQTISVLQRRLGVSPPRPRMRQREGLLPDEWWPAELVRLLEIPRASLQHWIRRGWVRARKLEEPLQRWVVWADEAERDRLRAYHQRTLEEDFRQRWATVPLAEQTNEEYPPY